MEKSAIQHAQETAHIPELIKQLTEANTAVPVALVPDSMSVKDLETMMPNAARYRLGFNTSSLEDFTSYSKKFDAEGATCFVDGDTMSAKTIFDLGTVLEPGHKQHKATLQMTASAEYSALLRVNGARLSQKDAAEFIEDWADSIGATTKDGSVMTSAAAAASIRDLTIKSARELNSKEDDFGAEMSAMERIEAKNSAQIVAGFGFTCEPYLGLDERSFHVRVSILTGGDKPGITYRIVGLEKRQQEMAVELQTTLSDVLADCETDVFVGEA
jgi:uncharacterized protein YfdQ (DUF2303 family)